MATPSIERPSYIPLEGAIVKHQGATLDTRSSLVEAARQHAADHRLYIPWVFRGYGRLAARWWDGLRDDYPQMIATARAELKAAKGDADAEDKARRRLNGLRAEYKDHRKIYAAKTAAGAAGTLGPAGYGVATGGLWVSVALGMATVAYGAIKGSPAVIEAEDDPGIIEIGAADGEPFPIADARTRTEAAECVRRALVSEGIKVAKVEAHQHHAWGWEITVQLAKGKPADVITKAPDLETPLDLPQDGLLCQPMRTSRGRVMLRLVESDPFARMPAAPERKPNSKRMRDAQLVAYRMDGAPFSVSLLGLHVLVIATSGGGKSVTMRTLADALTACDDVLVGDLDPGGNGLAPLADALGVRAIGDDAMGEIEAILEQALKIAKARPALFAELGMGDNWEPTREDPAIVLFLDEYPQLSDRAKELAVKILRVGRKSRVQLVIAAQEATADSLGDAIADSIALKIVGPSRHQDVKQVFGAGAGADGWRPDRLHPAQGDDPADAGKVYIMGGGSTEPMIYKFLALSVDEAARRGRERSAGRPTVGRRSLAAAGLDRFGASESDRLRTDLPRIVTMIRGAFAAADDPAFLPTVQIWEYLARTDVEVWGLERFGGDETKAPRLAAQRITAELKKAVDAMGLELDVTTRQITGGARGYGLDLIRQITGETRPEAA
ncbi:type IV secretory system conjugative DNA transfer family protein [Streptomyces sp. NPDC059016]|uniref:type IV secretory system conjugative DNA transfer family protein n=1 Tax=Streptomyces sp. NPDC059016 TaxID=3346699 RepID=UPI0036844661